MTEIPNIGILYGLVGVLLFRLRNPQREFLNTISVFVIVIFLSDLLFFYVDATAGVIVWILAGLALVVAYFLRVQSRDSRSGMDYIKLFGMVLVASYPIYKYEWYINDEWDILTPIANLILPINATIFIYDRWILKPEKMKSKFVVTLVVQVILILLFMSYAFFQQTAARRAQILAEKNAHVAIETKMEAEKCSEELAACQKK